MQREPLVLANELLDDEAPVDGAAIPEQHNRPRKRQRRWCKKPMTSTREYWGYGNGSKVKPLVRWGEGDGGDGRNPLASIAVCEDWGMADWCPSLAYVRDEEEFAFVEEYGMGPSLWAFF